MEDTKSILQSRTVWANIIGFIALAVSVLGVQTGGIDQSAIVDAILQVIAGASFLASTLARIMATKRLSG